MYVNINLVKKCNVSSLIYLSAKNVFQIFNLCTFLSTLVICNLTDRSCNEMIDSPSKNVNRYYFHHDVINRREPLCSAPAVVFHCASISVSLIPEPHSSWCVPKAISPVTMNLQQQQSTRQQTWVLRRRWGSAPGRCIGPQTVTHFVWSVNTDGWPCSTRDEMFTFTIATDSHERNSDRERAGQSSLLKTVHLSRSLRRKAALRIVLLSLNYLRFDLRHYCRRHTARPGGVLKHL